MSLQLKVHRYMQFNSSTCLYTYITRTYHKCLSCDTSSDSKELLQEHNQQAHGKKTTTVV